MPKTQPNLNVKVKGPRFARPLARGLEPRASTAAEGPRASPGPQPTVEKPSREKLDELKVNRWPIWTKEPSVFDWHYDDQETCYFLEGEVTVKTVEGEVSFGKGDMVTFPKGLGCTWHVRKAVRKHYHFGEL